MDILWEDAGAGDLLVLKSFSIRSSFGFKEIGVIGLQNTGLPCKRLPQLSTSSSSSSPHSYILYNGFKETFESCFVDAHEEETCDTDDTTPIQFRKMRSSKYQVARHGSFECEDETNSTSSAPTF